MTFFFHSKYDIPWSRKPWGHHNTHYTPPLTDSEWERSGSRRWGHRLKTCLEFLVCVFFPFFHVFFLKKNTSFLGIFLHVGYQIHLWTPRTGSKQCETHRLDPRYVFFCILQFFNWSIKIIRLFSRVNTPRQLLDTLPRSKREPEGVSSFPLPPRRVNTCLEPDEAHNTKGETGTRTQGPIDETGFRRLCPRLETRLWHVLSPWYVSFPFFVFLFTTRAWDVSRVLISLLFLSPPGLRHISGLVFLFPLFFFFFSLPKGPECISGPCFLSFPFFFGSFLHSVLALSHSV